MDITVPILLNLIQLVNSFRFNEDSTPPIKVGEDDNIYVAGNYSGTSTFETINGPIEKTTTGQISSYIHKLDKNGTPIWIATLDNDLTNLIYSLDINDNQILTVVGGFIGTTDFDSSLEYNEVTVDDAKDFVLRLNSCGDFIDVNFYDGGNIDHGDIQGNNIWIASEVGHTPQDFDPTNGVFELQTASAYDQGAIFKGTLSEVDGNCTPNSTYDEVFTSLFDFGIRISGKKMSLSSLSPNDKLSVYDVRGKLIGNKMIGNEGAITFDFKEKGIYLIKVTNIPGRSKTKKVVIK
jgi:hypothetical protein